MYLCLCKAISDRLIIEIIEEKKARTVKDIQKHCPAGGDCGSCIEKLKAFLKEKNKETAEGNSAKPSPSVLRGNFGSRLL